MHSISMLISRSNKIACTFLHWLGAWSPKHITHMYIHYACGPVNCMKLQEKLYLLDTCVLVVNQ